MSAKRAFLIEAEAWWRHAANFVNSSARLAFSFVAFIFHGIGGVADFLRDRCPNIQETPEVSQ